MKVIGTLASRMSGIQGSLMAQYEGGMSMASAAKGSEREVFLREYLPKVFPAHNRFSSGVIIDSRGRQTGQIDIAVEQPFSPSFPMPGSDSSRLLLAESVAHEGGIHHGADAAGEIESSPDLLRHGYLLQMMM